MGEKEVGDELAVNRVSTHLPNNIDFEEVPCPVVVVLLDAQLDWPDELLFSLRRFPRHHLHVTWDG